MMLLFLLTGCIQNVFFPPDLWVIEDSGRGRLNRTEDVATSTCDDNNAKWTWIARSEGWVDKGTLDLFRFADDVSEQHPMELIATDPGGEWDELMGGPLVAGVATGLQASGESTRFSCTLDAERLTVVVRFHDTEGTLLDCLIWGDSPERGLARIRNLDPQVSAIGGCRVLEQ